MKTKITEDRTIFYQKYRTTTTTFNRSFAIHWLKQGHFVDVMKISGTDGFGAKYKRIESWMYYIPKCNRFYYGKQIKAKEYNRILGYTLDKDKYCDTVCGPSTNKFIKLRKMEDDDFDV